MDNDDVRYFGKDGFRSVLLHPYITLTIKWYIKSSFSRDYDEGDFFKEILKTLQEICREIAFNKNSLKGTDLRFIESLPTQNVDHTA